MLYTIKGIIEVIFLIPLFLVAGCVNEGIKANENNPAETKVEFSDELKAPYEGKVLHLGVIGEKPMRAFNNIDFISMNPEQLKEKNLGIDAFIVTDQYFHELSNPEWKRTFQMLEIPIFFLNLDVQSFIFRVEGETYDGSNPPATMNTEGFVKTSVEEEEVYKSWGYGDPTTSTDPHEVEEWIFHQMFRDIEAFH